MPWSPYPGTKPIGTHWVEVWVNSIADLAASRKSKCILRRFEVSQCLKILRNVDNE